MQCKITKDLWNTYFPHIKLGDSFTYTVDVWFSNWNFVTKIELILISLFSWTLWHFQNLIIFRNTKFSKWVFDYVWKHTIANLGVLYGQKESIFALGIALKPIHLANVGVTMTEHWESKAAF